MTQEKKMRIFENHEDYPVRIFILTLVNGHERTFTEIVSAVKRQFIEREFTKQRIRRILDKLVRFNCISKEKLQQQTEDDCIFSYIMTNRGKKRMEYYKKKLPEKQ